LDAHFEKAGAKVVDSAYDSDILLKVRPPSNEEINKIKNESGLISFI
jgi:NAD/NADP transhydrogenase alpha subunit